MDLSNYDDYRDDTDNDLFSDEVAEDAWAWATSDDELPL